MITKACKALRGVFARIRFWRRDSHREASAARLVMAEQLWHELIRELGERGQGWRESGAFLLGPNEGDARRVTEVVYLDDLDPDCLTGGIDFDGRYYGLLWDICHARSLRVRADIHTHPRGWVDQSWIDRENPMVSRVGHLALIIPHLAQHPVSGVEVGIHEFLGAGGWHSSFGSDAAAMLVIEP
jgi:hypothetical protein